MQAVCYIVHTASPTGSSASQNISGKRLEFTNGLLPQAHMVESSRTPVF